MRLADQERRLVRALLGLTFLASIATQTWAQEPAPGPRSESPTIASVAPKDTATAPASAVAPTADQEARVRQLEALVRQLQTRRTSGTGPANSAPDTGTAPSTRGGAGTGQPGAGAITPSRSGGAGAPGQSLPPNPPVSPRFDSPATLVSKPGQVKFGPGFEIKSDDEEFFLQFHNLTQVDYRGYQQGGQVPVHDTFVMPRVWWIFSGRMTRPIGYLLSVQHSTDTFTMLDVFIDLNYDPRIQGRIGRFKTPFTYEFLVEPVQAMINPERSVFFANFGLNRDVGAMAYGRLWEGTMDYAVDVSNGTRNGYVGNHDGKFLSAFINTRLFRAAEGSLLENLNLGGSMFTGNANEPVTPAQLRTAVAISGNGVLGVPFLSFNNNVVERGNQTFWDLHLAYYYRQLAILSEWGSGAQDYALTNSGSTRTRVGVEGFYVQAGYLLTGETRSGIGAVKPFSPFGLGKGKLGTGAWELAARYQYLDISDRIFTAGLADPNNSANRVSIYDVGFNWWWTQFVKLAFEWEHADFNNPVIYAPGKRQLTSDMFMVRFQLYF